MIKVHFKEVEDNKIMVTHLKALKWKQLPQSYLMKGWRCWLSDDGELLYILTPENRVNKTSIGMKGYEYQIRRLEEDLEKCGEHLMKVREGLKKAREAKDFSRVILPKALKMSECVSRLTEAMTKEPKTIKVYV